MSSRDEILQRVRQAPSTTVELPALDDDWVRFDDPVAQFANVLSAVGGRCELVADLREAHATLMQIEPYAGGPTRISLVPGVGESTLDVATITDPHQLHAVDFAVLPGILAVAENGAVWVTDAACRVPASPSQAGDESERAGLSLRALYFIAQHVALVVPRQTLLHNMHEAYQRIDVGRTPFGAFISGPSKTADIEQALVIGAHGARSLTVLLVEEFSA